MALPKGALARVLLCLYQPEMYQEGAVPPLGSLFVVIGFDLEPGSVSALRLARKIDGKLVYVGKVGTGFTRKAADWAVRGMSIGFQI